MKITKQQKEFYKLFSQHGSGDALVQIDAKDVILLVHIAYSDLHTDEAKWEIPEFKSLAKKDFFEITPHDIDTLPNVDLETAVDVLHSCGATDTTDIIFLYLKNLSELYRRRFKFYNILKKQPFPLVEQIGPRCLLEYGNCSSDLLFNWMSWRKWIYDIDNRSAQETGYLFEPILASCLGGVSVSHKYSPVKRIDDSGNSTSEGRQIDCYIEDVKEVYELKLRVTIAASGQGRFSEEMSFPYEAERAGLTPILIVFDPTPSSLLDRLKQQYQEHGGRYAIGNDAWSELINRAGDEMGKFIKKYIQPPIAKMEEQKSNIPEKITLEAHADNVIIQDKSGNEYKIPRYILTE